MTDKTQEQIDAEAAAAKQAEADKAAAAEKKAADKAAKAEKAAAEKAEKAAAKEKAKQEAADKKAADAKAKEDAKAAAVAAKEAEKMPESNGVRRPKPETLCGKAWAIFDAISAKKGAPASIAEALVEAKAQGLNEGNVKAEYARWRKFFGVTGRVMPVAAAAAE
jgi:hypothetical protein